MAKKTSSTKPLISGGRTLSKMYQKHNPSSHAGGGKKATWYESFGIVYNGPAIGRDNTAWPTGQMPAFIRAEMARTTK